MTKLLKRVQLLQILLLVNNQLFLKIFRYLSILLSLPSETQSDCCVCFISTSSFRKVIPFVAPLQFSPWAFAFVKEIVSMSMQYPLVSGFYKLLSVSLNICSKTNYFKVSIQQLTQAINYL